MCPARDTFKKYEKNLNITASYDDFELKFK